MVLQLLAGLGLGGLVGAGQGPLLKGLEYGLNTLLPIEILNPNDLIDLHHRRGITTNSYYELMKRHGYDKETSKAYYYSKDAILTPEQAVVLKIHYQLGYLYHLEENPDSSSGQIEVHRQINADYNLRMKRQGYRASEAQDAFNANRPLPTFSTLLMWLSKEVFEPDQIAKFKLAAEQPSQLEPYFSTYGVPPAESAKYWIAHWATIGRAAWDNLYQRFRADRHSSTYSDIDPQELAEANVTWNDVQITPNDYADYYRVLELSPYFRDRGKGAVYNPLPFSVLQGLWQYAVLPYKQMVGRLRDYGYSKRSSELILEYWQRKYAYGKNEPLSDNITWKYSKRLITKQQAITKLTAAGVTLDAINFLLDKIDDKISEDRIQNKLKTLKTILQRESMTDSELTAKISAIVGSTNTERIDFELEGIKTYIANWVNRIGMRYAARAFSEGRLTETEFRAYLSSKYITGSDAEIAVKAYSIPSG